MAAEIKVVSELANRYASALFELADEAGSLEAAESDVKALQDMIADSDDLHRLVSSPAFTRDDQAKALNAVLEKADSGDLLRKFVGLVVSNGRAYALADMCRAFASLMAARRGEVVAFVTSAAALNDAQVAALKSELTEAMKTDVSVESEVDASIIGGLIVRVGSRMVDSSVRTKLQNLSFAMKGVE